MDRAGGERPALLAYRALGLGDYLTGVPACRALHRAYPDAALLLAAPEPLRPLVELTGGVTLLPTAELAPVVWPYVDPPLLGVDLHGTGPASHRLVRAVQPRGYVGFATPGSAEDGPRWRPDEHEVTRWCRLLVESGIPADAGDLELARPAVEPLVRAAAVVHCGAAYESRRWPADRFAEVARALVARGLPVVLTGSAAERGRALSIAAAAGVPAGHVVAGRTDLVALAALVADAALVVCGDTGIAHLATAYGTPSVVLFGPVSPGRWGPPARPQHFALDRGAGGGDPWGDHRDPALLRVQVDDVLASVDAVLAHSRPFGRRATMGDAPAV